MTKTVKIRIAGDLQQLDRLEQLLRSFSKQWGSRKIFRVKRYDRGSGLSKYHRTFGDRRFVLYIDMGLPNE